MKEHPILMSGPMVKAILEGRKTQTRRVVKLDGYASDGGGDLYETRDGDLVPIMDLCPYGRPGDLLWVREGFCYAPASSPSRQLVAYREDESRNGWEPGRYDWLDFARWRPSIHMPRWASRLTLRLTDVRVQRVQEITDGDVAAEGVDWSSTRIGNDHGSPARDAFVSLWQSISAKRGYGWETNPWVFALTFEVADTAVGS